MQKFIGLVVVYLLLSSSLLAQTAQITGTPCSEGNSVPLPGANITLEEASAQLSEPELRFRP